MKIQFLKNVYRSLFRDKSVEHPDLESRIDQHILAMTRLSFLMALVFWPIMLIMGYAANIPEIQILIMSCSTLSLVAVISVIGKQDQRLARFVCCATYMVFPGVIAHYVRVSMLHMTANIKPFLVFENQEKFFHFNQEILENFIGLFDRLLSVNFFYSHIVIFVAMIPMKIRHMPAVIALYCAFGYYGFQPYHNANWTLAFFFVLLIGVCIKAILEHMIVEATKKQLDNEDAIRQMTMAVIDRDLELARDIQLSIPVPARIVTDHLEIDFYLNAHHLVGGDWLAIKKDESGSYRVLIVDAAGKGMQASLIVHAVQSLWTASGSSMNPDSWIRLVNDTLCEMGIKSPHCLTMGLLQVQNTQLTYWSAGHCPMLVLSEINGRDFCQEILAPGDMIGISKKMALTPKTLDLSNYVNPFVILCSDGLLSAMSRGKLRRETIRKMESEFTETLNGMTSDDDMTVVAIKKIRPETPKTGHVA